MGIDDKDLTSKIEKFKRGEKGFWTLPKGNYELLGIHPELTEEQAKMVVEIHSITRLQSFGYKNYLKSTNYIHDFSCKTAKESFQSLMEREKCYTVNPYGKMPEYETQNILEYFEYRKKLYKWQEAQQTTFDKYAILIKSK